MGGETAGDDSAEKDGDGSSFVWVSVGGGNDAAHGGNQSTDVSAGHGGSGAEKRQDAEESTPGTGGGPSGPEERPAPTGGPTGSSPEETGESEAESIDPEALIAEEPPDERGGDGDAESEPRETPDPSSQADESAPTGSRGDRERRDGRQSSTGSSPTDGQSDRLWNRYGQDEADTTDDDRLWKGGESRGTGSKGDESDGGTASTASEGGGAPGPAAGSDEAPPEGGDEQPQPQPQPQQDTRFDRLLERSDSGSGSARPVGSQSVETDLDAFFSDLEEFDQATSGSQVLVISPGGHSITDEVCSKFLTAGGVSRRNAMFVTAVESPSDRVEICRESDEWGGGNVAVIELGNTGSDSDDALEPVGGEEVIRKRVNSPKNLSKTGLLITQTLKKWSDRDQPSVLCFHTLTAISGYVENETLFQFLFTLQAKLNSFGVTGHYHMDAGRHDQQEINTLKTLFDVVITISQSGEIEVE
jgi:hypothetical protein